MPWRTVLDSEGGAIEFFVSESAAIEIDVLKSACIHRETVIASVTHSNDAIHLAEVCQECGNILSHIKRRKSAARHPIFDYKRRQREYFHECHARRLSIIFSDAEIDGHEPIVKRDSYEEYINTDRWRKRRELYLELANKICQICFVNRATQAHHKTYLTIFFEKDENLLTVCVPCHKAIHGR